MARNNQRGRRNNNPEGRNQFSGGFRDMARERPVAAAVTAAGAVAAGVFLWSRRSQISEQLSNISDQLGEWNENRSSDQQFEGVGGGAEFSGSETTGAGGSRSSGSGSGGRNRP